MTLVENAVDTIERWWAGDAHFGLNLWTDSREEADGMMETLLDHFKNFPLTFTVEIVTPPLGSPTWTVIVKRLIQ